MAAKERMDTQTITVRVKGTSKEQAETILADIGLTFTGYINACLQALVRERRIPFDMVTSDEYALRQQIRVKLEESEAIANDPTAKRYSHEEIFAPLRKKYGYEVQD